jgi:hypothetical protein
VYLAAESALDREHANAILSVLTVSQDKLAGIVKDVNAVYSAQKERPVKAA